MGIFGDILKTGFDVITAPIDVAKDVVTLGGALTDQKAPYIVQKAEQLVDDLSDIREYLEDL